MKRIFASSISGTIAAFAIFLSAHPQATAESETVPFPGLKTLAANDADTIGILHYESSLANVIRKVIDDEHDIVRLVSTPLAKAAKTRYFIDFDPGPSVDPVFVFTEESTNQIVARISADSLFVPGNGFIYASGRSNNMHLERRKYEIKSGELVEVRQPFAYVGLDTKANVPLKLTTEKNGGEVIANIPKDGSLQVVIREGEYLLIRTTFGLVGWWKMETNVLKGNEEIEGIYYAGD